MAFLENNWLEIINTISVAIVGLILFGQKTRIKSLNDFINIFDVEKLKKSTEYILEGEKSKHEIDIREIKKNHKITIRAKEEELKEYESVVAKSKTDKRRLEPVFGMGFAVSRLIHYSNSTISIVQTNLLNMSQLPLAVEDFKINSQKITDFALLFIEYQERISSLYSRIVVVMDRLEEDIDKSAKLINELNSEYEQLESEIQQTVSDVKTFEADSGAKEYLYGE